MPSLQVRDLPESIHLRLAERARREHRTISQEATVLLARALEVSLGNVERRRSVLEGLKAEPLTAAPALLKPPEELVREDRER
jgi:plasmid stability protein